MGIKLSLREKELLQRLTVAEPKIVSQQMMISENTIYAMLHNIRRKYKEARWFVNYIDQFRQKNPEARTYLRTRETL
jgi:hypothetical protein